MQRLRVRFTMRWMMVMIAIVGLVLAYVVHRERRIRRLERMARDQAVTIGSAIANVGNARLARESAEFALREYSEKYGGPPEAVSRTAVSPAPISADQSRLLASLDAERAEAEERFKRIVQQLNDGTFTDGALVAPAAVQTAIRRYVETLEKHVQATRDGDASEPQDPVEKSRFTLERKIEDAGAKEQIKKMILDYEKAYLKSLRRERLNSWW